MRRFRRDSRGNREVFEALGLLGQMGLTAAVAVIMSVVFGGWLDRTLGTGGVFTAVMAVLGGGAGIVSIYKSIARFIRRADKNDKGLVGYIGSRDDGGGGGKEDALPGDEDG